VQLKKVLVHQIFAGRRFESRWVNTEQSWEGFLLFRLSGGTNLRDA
jgi:hypothetical protein